MSLPLLITNTGRPLLFMNLLLCLFLLTLSFRFLDRFVHSGLQPPFAQNGTVVNLRMSTRFCTKGGGFQFLAKFAILPQNANSLYLYRRGLYGLSRQRPSREQPGANPPANAASMRPQGWCRWKPVFSSEEENGCA